MGSPVHATLVAGWREGRWRGVLIRGPSGAGKSTLALQLIARHSFRLVADDRVLLWRSGDRAWGAAPATLRGLLEVRGVGVLPHPALASADVALVTDLVAATDRFPTRATDELGGVDVPALALPVGGEGLAERLACALQARPWLSGR